MLMMFLIHRSEYFIFVLGIGIGAFIYLMVFSDITVGSIRFPNLYQQQDQTENTTVGVSTTTEPSETIVNPTELIGLISENVRLVDISTDKLQTPINSFCVFENETGFLKTDLFIRLITASKWQLFETESNDPRLYNRWKNMTKLSKITTHYLLSNTMGEVVHLKVLIPRNNYFWIAEYHSSTTMVKVRNSTSEYRLSAVAIDAELLANLTEKYDITTKPSVRLFSPANRDLFSWHMEKSKFLECDYEGRVWPFWNFYQEMYESYDESLVQRTLAFFRKISFQHKVPLELYAGTLLGWYRQCDFIPYSKDMDFAVDITYFTQSFFETLWHSGLYPMSQRFGTQQLGLEINGYYENQLKVDIFSWSNEGDQMFTYYYLWNLMKVKRIGYAKKTELCTCELLGQLAYVSCDPFSHIKTEYGIYWFEPKTGTVTNNLVNYRQYKQNETAEFNQVYHAYSERNCTSPTIMNGCD